MQYNVKHLYLQARVSNGLSSLELYPVVAVDPLAHLARWVDEKCSPVFL